MMWHQRRSIGQLQREAQVTEDSIQRLKMEKRLIGHEGCVNCIEWSAGGEFLASGSDDRKVILWNPYRGSNRRRRATIDTGHRGNIFSVKFMPHSRNEQVASCGADGQVQVYQLCQPQPVLSCHSCHSAPVKRLATHPDEPHLLWSAAEDGLINQYDLRQDHRCPHETGSCRERTNANVLIDLRQGSSSVFGAKCLALHPLRKEIVAVGTNDPFVRLFDRRYLSRSHSCAESQAVDRFAPGHLVLNVDEWDHRHQYRQTSSCLHSFGTTSLCFSLDGSQLLANYHAEQVYLFNLDQPRERYKSFETVASLVFGDRASARLAAPLMNRSSDRIPASSLKRGIAPWRGGSLINKRNRNWRPSLESSSRIESARSKLARKLPISLDEMAELNRHLAADVNNIELLNMRSAALIRRNWRGDCYLAIRDCCCCLALDRFNAEALENLARASQRLDDRLCVERLLAALEALARTLGPSAGPRLGNLVSGLAGISRRSPPIVAANYASTIRDIFGSHIHQQPGSGEPDKSEAEDDDDETMDSCDQSHSHRIPSSRSLSASSSSSTPDVSWQDLVAFLESDVSLNQGKCLTSEQQLDYNDNDHQQNNYNNYRNLKQQPQLTLENCYDFTSSYTGHSNISTDIKEASFFGRDGEYIVAGSDDGAFFIWDRVSSNLVKAVQGDSTILNCLQPHPSVCLLATSGIDSCIKLWSPIGRKNCDVDMLERRCTQNQNYMSADPFDALISHLGQPLAGIHDEIYEIW